MKVHISPTYTGADQADGGIRRVVEAQARYLPEFGIEVVENPMAADLCAIHGTMIPPRTDLPIVTHCHGMYWKEYAWPGWADAANRAVIDRMLMADAVTAPSRWVANAIARGSLIAPEVIYHGVDADEWQPGENLGYVLWNKARADAVSNPEAVGQLAALMPNTQFVSTFGPRAENVQLIGSMPVDAMRQIVSRAGVYLATVRETFGIGTLEALACGVPVVGWKFGGQEEIIHQDVNGFLVEYGDYDGLAHAVHLALANRRELGENARADAIARWGWRDRIAQYADLYHRTLARQQRPRVSVVITTHNLNRFLPEAVSSAVDQADQVIVIDDAGEQVAADALSGLLRDNLHIHRLPQNVGLSAARNAGAALATGRYLLFLDADDILAPGATSRLADALDKDPTIHIAGGLLDTISEDGSGRRRNPWPGQIDWKGQVAHLNQLHYAAMWRKDAFDRTGGYRARHWRAEDAALWARVMSLGLRAKLVTTEPTLIYRMRSNSKSRMEATAHPDRDGDWTIDLPWRIGDGTAAGGMGAMERGIRPPAHLVPWSAPGGSPGRRAWPIPHHQEPAVSVIIPVGPGHAHTLIDALDSLIAQDCGAWEAIVVNDTGMPLEATGSPWARIIDGGGLGAGAARNLGAEAARAPLLLFLDADDMLTPGALTAMLTRYANGDAAFVYGDCAVVKDKIDQPIQNLRAAEFSAHHWLTRARNQEPLGLPAVTMLISRQAFQDVGGFDPAMSAWEDGDLYLKLCHQGYQGARVDQTVLSYRITTGQRRNGGEAQVRELHGLLASRYQEDYTMARKSSCCGGNAPAVAAAAQATIPPPDPEQPISMTNLPTSGDVDMAYTGDQIGEHSVTGRPSLRTYRVGNNPFAKYFRADVRDVEYLISMGTFQLIPSQPLVMAE